MFVWARRLKLVIKQWIAHDWKFLELLLIEDELHQIDEAILFLKPFWDYTRDISSTTNATIHNVFFIYNDIFDHIGKQWYQVSKLLKATWIHGLLDATKAVKLVLQKYYSTTTQREFIYTLATILDPSKKLSLYEE